MAAAASDHLAFLNPFAAPTSFSPSPLRDATSPPSYGATFQSSQPRDASDSSQQTPVGATKKRTHKQQSSSTTSSASQVTPSSRLRLDSESDAGSIASSSATSSRQPSSFLPAVVMTHPQSWADLTEAFSQLDSGTGIMTESWESTIWRCPACGVIMFQRRRAEHEGTLLCGALN